MSAATPQVPAFPTPVYEWNDEVSDYQFSHVADGMTLRDYFAAKAMPQALALLTTGLAVWGECGVSSRRLAELSFHLADAMLKARGD